MCNCALWDWGERDDLGEFRQGVWGQSEEWKEGEGEGLGVEWGFGGGRWVCGIDQLSH